MDTNNICKKSIVTFENYSIKTECCFSPKNIINKPEMVFEWMPQKDLGCMQYAYF